LNRSPNVKFGVNFCLVGAAAALEVIGVTVLGVDAVVAYLAEQKIGLRSAPKAIVARSAVQMILAPVTD